MVDGFWLIMLSFLLLTCPPRWLAASILAAAFHELSHLGAIWLLGGQVLSFRAGARGAVLEVAELSPWREALAAAAGPAGSLLLLLLAGVFPSLALCGLGQGLFNLLPVFPLDGGRILFRILEALGLGKQAEKITAAVSWLTLGAVGGGCVLLGAPLAALFILPLAFRNISCKEGRGIVQ